MNNKSVRQTGVIPTYPLPQDYKLGGETTIKVEDRTNDWTPYAPSSEKQSSIFFDTNSCTSFSLDNVAEFQLNYLLAEKKMSLEAGQFLLDNGYLDSNGKINLSDRFLAIMSKTSPVGNDFRAVAEALRTIGAIPEKDLPFGGTNQTEYLDPKLITPTMLAKAKKFLEYFKVEWDWTFYDQSTGFNEEYQVEGVIKQTPVQIGITTPATHATTLYKYDPTVKTFYIYDTYEPFYFQGSADNYNPHFGMRIIISETGTVTPTPVTPAYVFKMTLTKGMKGEEVKQLQRFLISQGLMKVGLDTGFFGDITFQAVRNFQMRQGISTTGNVGTLTNARINQILASKKKLNNLTISLQGIELIKSFEGLGDGNKATTILEPYKDATGFWTIGYGNRFINGYPVTKNTPAITQVEANQLLLTSLKAYEQKVKDSVTVELSQNQYDALCSFCFNLGNIDGLKDKINTGMLKTEDFMKFVYSKGVKLQGLVTRRSKEATLYFKK